MPLLIVLSKVLISKWDCLLANDAESCLGFTCECMHSGERANNVYGDNDMWKLDFTIVKSEIANQIPHWSYFCFLGSKSML